MKKTFETSDGRIICLEKITCVDNKSYESLIIYFDNKDNLEIYDDEIREKFLIAFKQYRQDLNATY